MPQRTRPHAEPCTLTLTVKVDPLLADGTTVAQLRTLFDEFAVRLELLEAVRAAEVGAKLPANEEAKPEEPQP